MDVANPRFPGSDERVLSLAQSKTDWLANALAALLLMAMAAFMFTSVWDDTATSDDNVALISGYSYLVKKEYRLEPQNPPLIKDLAALPLLFRKIQQPWDSPGWGDVNDPDQLGRHFLFLIGNDADAILRTARAPMILFAVAFGGLFYLWTRKEFGAAAALLALFLYAFSPTILAHGRLVATDLGATAGFFLGLIAFLRFLKDPSRKNMVWAGLALGFALLTKFSTIALIPILLFLGMAWALVNLPFGDRELKRGRRGIFAFRKTSGGYLVFALRLPTCAACAEIWRYLWRTVAIIALGFVVIYPVYLHHLWNYPPEIQLREAQLVRRDYDLHGTARDLVLWASDKSVLRPWAEYFIGLLMALKASRWGQPVFFLGQSYNTGLISYFPFVYLVKEPLTMHLLTLAALGFALSRVQRERFQLDPLRAWLADNFTTFALVVVVAVYWTALLRSNMNIGVRHLLPAFPLTYILVSNQIMAWYRSLERRPTSRSRHRWSFIAVLGGLLLWQAVSVAKVHPSYLAYFNEMAGGPNGGWRYVNDSNLDWGQDFKRLADFVQERGIPGIYVDAFGPNDPTYYLREKHLGTLGCTATPKGWVAVSAMLYPGAPWNPACDYRQRLPLEKLVAKIGYSIFVFHVE